LVEKREQRFFYGYVIVIIAFFFGALAWGSLRTLGVYLEPLVNEFAWMRGTISLAFTVCMVVTGLVGIVAGRLTDRFGPGVVMAVGGCFLGAGYLLVSQVSNIWQLYLCYGVIVAIGMGGFQVPMSSTVARWFIKRRGLMTGLIMAGPAFGITTVPLVVSWLIIDYGWRTSFIMMGSVVMVLIILGAQFARRNPGQIGETPYGEDERKGEGLDEAVRGFSLKEAIGSRQFWVLGLISFGYFFNINVVMVHIVIHATGAGISPLAAVSVLSTTAAISVAGRIIAGGVADRMGRRKTVMVGFGLTLVAFLWLLAGSEIWMLYLFAVVFGIGGWAVNAVMSPMVAELFGMREHGVILGMVTFTGTIGGAAGPLLAGYIFDITGSYQLAFVFCGILSVAGVVLTLFLRPANDKGGGNDSRRST